MRRPGQAGFALPPPRSEALSPAWDSYGKFKDEAAENVAPARKILG
jgi:hypothetical protein